jgi:hypothetical protein
MVPPAIRCSSCRASIPADVLAAVGDVCPHCHRPLSSGAKHDRAVAQTLDWADEAAARGEHAEALAWLQTIEAVGDRLSDAYEQKRGHWQAALSGSAGERSSPRGSIRAA